eukprot:TRINITY_DN7975_c0_g1_i1.p1 TRINITY_DN7975_c0_g1~~TRINITY_DN7975_c0_g1_i1.p1  ORF type:complete len:373 (-),score=31.84 TRINITY_DN7975_c0_g1_i1:19-1137(-)
MDALPVELLQLIVTHASPPRHQKQLALLSKKFGRADALFSSQLKLRWKLGDELLKKLVLKSKRVSILSFQAQEENLSPDTLSVILRECSSLRSLSLGSREGFMPHFWPNVSFQSKSFTKVTDLQVSNLRTTDVLPVVKIFPKLKRLEISDASQLDSSFSFAPIASLTNLTWLKVQRCFSRPQETASSIFTSLEGLELSSCFFVDNTTLPELFDISKISSKFSLQFLSLPHCHKLCDLGLQPLVSQLPNLLSLNLSGCKLITDSLVQFIAESCRYLLSLKLSECCLLTDRTLLFVGTWSLFLSELCISRCLQIGDQGIRWLLQDPNVQGLRKEKRIYLKEVDLSGTKITTASLHILNQLSCKKLLLPCNLIKN